MLSHGKPVVSAYSELLFCCSLSTTAGISAVDDLEIEARL
jgi:hypothetical protein